MSIDVKKLLQSDDSMASTAWLLTMQMARQRRQFKREAEAKRMLAKLGVTVTYSHKPVEVPHAR